MKLSDLVSKITQTRVLIGAILGIIGGTIFVFSAWFSLTSRVSATETSLDQIQKDSGLIGDGLAEQIKSVSSDVSALKEDIGAVKEDVAAVKKASDVNLSLLQQIISILKQ